MLMILSTWTANLRQTSERSSIRKLIRTRKSILLILKKRKTMCLRAGIEMLHSQMARSLHLAQVKHLTRTITLFFTESGCLISAQMKLLSMT